METLPIDAVLPRLLDALAAGPAAVLSAPPGAGKTTRVPLALLRAPWLTGRLLMLEPRRIAARAAAERLAAGLGEPVGRSVGYRIRGESRRGSRIEVVTEGVLTRMLQSAPDLPGVGCILFDEVHERSIHSDLGLALALEVQEALRPELRLVAMSATLDVAEFARLLGNAPVIESEGRLHPVETRWLDRPWRRPGEGRRGFI
jgi:ATP-dependent helicase HrpB